MTANPTYTMRLPDGVKAWQWTGRGGMPPEVDAHMLRILAGGGGPIKTGDWIVLTGRVLELLSDAEFRERCEEVPDGHQ